MRLFLKDVKSNRTTKPTQSGGPGNVVPEWGRVYADEEAEYVRIRMYKLQHMAKAQDKRESANGSASIEIGVVLSLYLAVGVLLLAVRCQ